MSEPKKSSTSLTTKVGELENELDEVLAEKCYINSRKREYGVLDKNYRRIPPKRRSARRFGYVLSINMSLEQHDAVMALAKARGVTANSLVREAIRVTYFKEDRHASKSQSFSDN